MAKKDLRATIENAKREQEEKKVRAEKEKRSKKEIEERYTKNTKEQFEKEKLFKENEEKIEEIKKEEAPSMEQSENLEQLYTEQEDLSVDISNLQSQRIDDVLKLDGIDGTNFSQEETIVLGKLGMDKHDNGNNWAVNDIADAFNKSNDTNSLRESLDLLNDCKEMDGTTCKNVDDINKITKMAISNNIDKNGVDILSTICGNKGFEALSNAIKELNPEKSFDLQKGIEAIQKGLEKVEQVIGGDFMPELSQEIDSKTKEYTRDIAIEGQSRDAQAKEDYER